jgi:hypothetical protein
MAKKNAPPLELDCPCCHSRLTIDPQLGVVLSHEPPPKSAPDVDLEDTARLLREEAERREAKFRQSVEAEKKKSDVLDRLFEEGLRKAKDKPAEKPIRDFDLD